MSAKYAVIRAHRGQYPLTLMCAALGIGPSSYYAAQRRPASARQQSDARLAVTIRMAYVQSRRRYGAPRIHRELRAHGTYIGKKRVARLMRAAGLVARPKRRFVRTTDSAHGAPIGRNVLARQFAPRGVGGLNTVWVSDITYIPTRAGWLYLATVMDLASRRVIGWAMRDTLAEALALDALRMALVHRQPRAGLLHHSDRGVQYAGSAYRALLATHGLQCSMSRRGNCWDNAVAESFFATLEHELLHTADFHTHREARDALFEFIEVWYNRQRRHSTLNYLSPAEYESRLAVA